MYAYEQIKGIRLRTNRTSPGRPSRLTVPIHVFILNEIKILTLNLCKLYQKLIHIDRAIKRF